MAQNRQRRASLIAVGNNGDDSDGDGVVFVEAKRIKSTPSREVEVFDLT